MRTETAVTRRTVLGAAFSYQGMTAAMAQAPSRIMPAQAAYEQAKAGALILVDIRTPTEWADTGVPHGAIRLDAEASGFEVRLAGLRLDHPGRRIALIDRTGGLSASVQRTFANRGWRDLVVVRGGMLGAPGVKGWLADGLPVNGYP